MDPLLHFCKDSRKISRNVRVTFSDFKEREFHSPHTITGNSLNALDNTLNRDDGPDTTKTLCADVELIMSLHLPRGKYFRNSVNCV